MDLHSSAPLVTLPQWLRRTFIVIGILLTLWAITGALVLLAPILRSM